MLLLSCLSNVGQQGGVENGFPDVPVHLVVVTLLATMTGDGGAPYFEEIGNNERLIGDVFLLLAVVVKVVVAFNFLGRSCS